MKGSFFVRLIKSLIKAIFLLSLLPLLIYLGGLIIKYVLFRTDLRLEDGIFPSFILWYFILRKSLDAEKRIKKLKEKYNEGKFELNRFILDEINNNSTIKDIQDTLIEIGISNGEALNIVNAEIENIEKSIINDEPNENEKIYAIIGGLLGSIIGGAVWGVIILLTGLELAVLSILTTIITIFMIQIFGKNKKGFFIRVITIASSVFGILIGKYFFFVKSKNYADLSYLSIKSVFNFFNNINLLFDLYDIYIFLPIVVYLCFKSSESDLLLLKKIKKIKSI